MPVARQAGTPAELADVALIAARGCAATGDMSISQWHALVRERIAPQPVIRRSRYTRWSLSEVRSFFLEFATKKQDDLGQCAVMERARRASQASKRKRQAGGPALHQDCRHGQGS
ncbi:MAG TPA: hypothetical protein PKC60_03250 [Hydrogenophaga sp.]|uniref:hypothetical protein n=1 Tax=Hydrogenophaga sp. TaxID=1904254 RepID=UPI002CF3CF10|nr:hypothetical protein [Hydrogenophaga sp.]HMN92226.1 hypothetical protein [Hydrogenophaga sp.]